MPSNIRENNVIELSGCFWTDLMTTRGCMPRGMRSPRNWESWADSSRQRNDFCEFFLGHHIVEGFSWSPVQGSLNTYVSCCSGA
jgi:hypothetical protein